MKPFLLFASTYIAVFALGFQSLNVNQKRYAWAAITSLAIGGSHILLYRYMPDAHAAEVLAYLAGGVLGITSSMYFHSRAVAWWARVVTWRPDWRGAIERAIAWRPNWQRLDAYLEEAFGYHNTPDAPPAANPSRRPGSLWRGQYPPAPPPPRGTFMCIAETACKEQCNYCREWDRAFKRSDAQ